MSSTVRFQLRPSPLFAALIIGAHLAAAAAVYSAIPGWTAGALAIALFLLGLAAAWSRALLRSPASIRAIQLGGEPPVFELASGESLGALVGDRRYVTRFVVSLPLASPLSRTLFVTADMLGAQEFRRLRLWALWERLPGVAPAQLAP